MNYGGIEAGTTAYENAKFVVIPVPYDLTSTYQSGSRQRAWSDSRCVRQHGALR